MDWYRKSSKSWTMARGERRQAFGSSKRKLVHVAAATAAAAAGISLTWVPESTSQRQPNQAAREAALNQYPPVVVPVGTLRVPEDPLMLDILVRHRIVSPGFEAPGRTGRRI